MLHYAVLSSRESRDNNTDYNIGDADSLNKMVHISEEK